jgi:DNA-binding Xre family transcriptional regulator
MDPQFIKTPGGEEMVIISRADYDAILVKLADLEEDAADVAIYDARMADLSAGRDERLPEEVSSAMLRGASLLTALRKWRGVTQLDLAAKAGVGQGYLSDLESGRRKGAPETLDALSTALDVPRDWLP